MNTSKRVISRTTTCAVLLLGAALLLAACGGEPTPLPTPEVSLPNVKIESGAMALPGAQDGLTTTATAGKTGDAAAATDTTATAAAAAPAAGPVYAVGQQVIATDAVRVYAEPDTRSTQYGTYPGGASLTVVEPSDDYAGYPVAVNGQAWYRVRFPDGLVGWVQAVVITAQ